MSNAENIVHFKMIFTESTKLLFRRVTHRPIRLKRLLIDDGMIIKIHILLREGFNNKKRQIIHILWIRRGGVLKCG